MTTRSHGYTATSAIVGLGLLLGSLPGCAPAVESSKVEDNARRTIPVPICLKSLPRHGTSGVVSSLQPADYWGMILPAFDAASNSVDRSSPDCAGRELLSDPSLAEATGPRSGPIVVKEDDAVVTSGPDGFKIVWLRTHHFADDTAAGPIALVRPREAYAEVYSTGLYRGSATKSQFTFERLGPHILVTGTNEGCADVKPGQNCQTTLSLFLSHNGKLEESAKFALDRIQYGQAPGVAGTAQYRLTATPAYGEKSVRVLEQVVVRDASATEVRKSDLERTFSLKSGKLVASSDSLWNQVTGFGATPPPAPPPPPSKTR